jgi:hypothetical protein
MANTHGKLLYSTKVDGLKSSGQEITVGVYGIFKSQPGSGKWEYFLISYFLNKNGNIELTSDWHNIVHQATYDIIQKYSKSVKDIDEGKKICDEFKLKWISGSNDTIQEVRETKIQKILN